MPSYMLGKVLDTVVGAKFPGGVEGWAQAGCDLVALPNPSGRDVVYILLPEGTTGGMDLKPFRDEVERYAKVLGYEARWASTPNFEGRNPAEIKALLEPGIESLNNIVEKLRVMRAIHRASLFVLVMDGSTEEEASKILDVLDGVEGLERAAVIAPGVLAQRSYRRTSGLQAEHQGMGRPLSGDDVANLKIMLHEADTVEDFLKGLK